MDPLSINELAQKFPVLRNALGAQSQAVDVGGCGTPASCDTNNCGGAVIDNKSCPGVNIYTTTFVLGFQLGVDCDGNIYVRDCHKDSAGTVDDVAFVAPSNNPTQLQIDFDQGGFLCIYGINANLLDGPPVVINALESSTDLQRHNGAALTIYETTGCWCPFEACIIGGQTPLNLELKSVPTPSDTVRTSGAAPFTPFDSRVGGARLPDGYYSSLEISFLATAVRALGGSALIANQFYSVRNGQCP